MEICPWPNALAGTRYGRWVSVDEGARSPRDFVDRDLYATWEQAGGAITFSDGEYAAMRDDEVRTRLFTEAIRRRLRGHEGELVVLDIGTGPFALLALIAARAGAKKVFAIEGSPDAARMARAAVAAATDIVPGAVEVIDGWSTRVDLPCKVDLVIAEIVGDIASEEALYATLSDAQERLVKRPWDASSYIPTRCQTWCAPASYCMHGDGVGTAWATTLLGDDAPTVHNWESIAHGETVFRVPCTDPSVQLLSAPQLLEDVGFSAPMPPPEARLQMAEPIAFTIDAARLRDNRRAFRYLLEMPERREALFEAETAAVRDAAAAEAAAAAKDAGEVPSAPRNEGLVDANDAGALAGAPAAEANLLSSPAPKVELTPAAKLELSSAAASSFSGIAMWPRLQLDVRRHV